MNLSAATIYVMQHYRAREPPDWTCLAELAGCATEKEAREFQIRVLEEYCASIPWSRLVAEKPPMTQETRAKLRDVWAKRKESRSHANRTSPSADPQDETQKEGQEAEACP